MADFGPKSAAIDLKNTYLGEYTNDADVYGALNTDLGPKLKWNPGPSIGGGTLHCESASYAFTRTLSSITAAAKWH